MSYITNSSKIKDNYIYPFAKLSSNVQQKDKIITAQSDNITAPNFNSTAPDIDLALPDIDINMPDIEPIESNIIDVEKLTEIYENNPKEILNEFGDFNDADKKKLNSLINNKKDLKAFLTILNHKNLNKDDAIAAMKKVNKKSSDGLSGYFSRAINVIKKVFTDGIPEAIELAKSEKGYYSKHLSDNMEEIRKIRDDFSSDGLADCADLFVNNEDIKNYGMHFITKDEIAGKKLYDENSVLKAIEKMAQNPKDAELFRNNAIELESIKDENGYIRYKGSTIVDVDTKMIENKDLQPTMMKTAYKSDMNDEYLLGITDNLVQNPEMDYALNAFLDCKDVNGNDKFSAENLFAQTSYMVDKKPETIQTYCNNTLELAQYPNISGDDIVTAAETVTNYPQSKESVYVSLYSNAQKINANNSCCTDNTETNRKTDNYQTIPIPNPQTAQYPKPQDNSVAPSENKQDVVSNQVIKSQKQETTQKSAALSDPIVNKKEKNKQKTNSNNNYLKNTTSKLSQQKLQPEAETKTKEEIKKEETKQAKQEISQYLYKKYGASGDLILKKLEENPAFLSIIEKYGNNKEIIVSLIKNPTSITKITSMSPSITTDQLATFVKLCTSTEKTDTVIKLIQNFGPQKALRLAEKADCSNKHKDILDVLDKHTIKLENKKEKIENIIDNNTPKRHIDNVESSG